ncbi:hypothetical protein AWR36_012305 [Microbulbifer flavimaris]|uniref:Uncharacterized protein n=1 Tax=Microbulbifer flavimaris TaxID=1781068 RepID=A0ABX4HZM4_9GAMM|nr:hypothetical protein AVO43_12270 [Microbulbifer sp. ZGT114]PCO04774.1 hypothetical protein AWR36_012305 [Microbulbifer flavimaris]
MGFAVSDPLGTGFLLLCALLSIVMACVGFSSGNLIGMLAHSGSDWRNGLFFATEILLILWGTACYLQQRRQGLSPA